MFFMITKERADWLSRSLHHAPKVTYDRSSESYIATCPDCDWSYGPDLGARVNDRAYKHRKENDR